MRVYFRPFLEYSKPLDKEAEADPKNVKIYQNEDGSTITTVHPIETYDEKGSRRYDLPEVIQFRPRLTDWKLRVDIVGKGDILVLRNGRALRAKNEHTNRNGELIRKYSGGSGEMVIKLMRDGQIVSMQPVVRYSRRRNDYFIDPRTRNEGPPEIQKEFLERVTAREPRIDLIDLPPIELVEPKDKTGQEAEHKLEPEEELVRQNQYHEDEDNLSPEEAAATLARYREERPLSRGPHRTKSN